MSTLPRSAWRHAASRTEDACLPLLIPSEARTFKVADPPTAVILADLGADLVNGGADVEIADLDELTGDALHAITHVGVDVARRDSQGRTQRAARRVAGHVEVRLRARAATQVLDRHGYAFATVLLWDKGQRVRLPDTSSRERPVGDSRLRELLPQRALVRGSRKRGVRTLFEVTVDEADAATPDRLRPERLLARSGLLVGVAPAEVLRVAVGPARHRIRAQVAVLRALHGGRSPARVRALVPGVVTTGTSGLAHYSLETRMAGARAPRVLGAHLTEDVLDFLAALHTTPVRPPEALGLSTAAAAVGRFVGARERSALVQIAGDTERALRGVPRGLAHGDFFHGNMLVEAGRLVGVIDWDSARGGQLPLLDLLHLQLNAAGTGGASPGWGPAIVRTLLPWARGGGDALAGAYCRRLGLALGPDELHGLVVAYWLTRLDYQLSTYDNRADRPTWLANNITAVLQALAEQRPQGS